MKIKDQIELDLEKLGEDPYDWQSMTAREIYTELEKSPNVCVYWGCWDDSELDCIPFPEHLFS